MDGENITSSQSSLQSNSSVGNISILVVDDDTTCLAIVAAILKTWKYEVVTVKHAIDALCTLRIKGASFDLVVSDVHMPDMNGFELQKQIDEEFNLPVVLMSADDKEGVILKGLENGAALFLVKPISPDDLKNLWQYAIAKKKGKPVPVEETGSVQGTFHGDKASNKDIESASSANEETQSKKDPKRKVPRKDIIDEKGEDDDNSATPKKAKVVWTNALHNRFLEAIRRIGLERAVPKKILELMKVQGLTRENVASHLQKYRIFLKRVSDASYKIHSTEKSLADGNFQSSLESKQPSLMFNKLQQQYLQYPEQQQMKASFERRSRKHVPFVKAPNQLGFVPFPNQEALKSNSMARPRYGQSYLLGNQGNFQKTMFSNASPIYQANRFDFRVEPNDYKAGLTSHGGISSSSMQMYQQKTSPKSLNLTNGMSKYNSTTITGHGRMGAFNSCDMNSTFHSDSNYAGYQMASDGIVGSGHMGYLSGHEDSNDFNGNYGLIRKIQNGNMAAAPTLSENNSGNLAQGVPYSAGFVIGNQFSPLLAIDQQGSASVPLLLPTQQQRNSLGDEGEDDDYIFNLMNHCSTHDNDSLQHGEDDLSITFLMNLQQGGDEVLSSSFSYGSYHVEDNPQGNEQSLEQQHDGEEVMGSNFSIGGDCSDDCFPWLDQHPKQKQGHGELVDSEDHGTYHFNNSTVSRSHVSPTQLDDEGFIESVFSSDAFGGSYSHGGF